MATGRSDYPNQVNNVLGFPFIFRGALDVMATAINDEMKLAAAQALATLAKEDVPDSVIKAYGGEKLQFGRDYIIPKPLDPARAALGSSGGGKGRHGDRRCARSRSPTLMPTAISSKAGSAAQRRSCACSSTRPSKRRSGSSSRKATEEKILRASQIILDEEIATPILLGDRKVIEEKIKMLDLDLPGVEIVDPTNCQKFDEYVSKYYDMRKRKGITRADARAVMPRPADQLRDDDGARPAMRTGWWPV